MKYTAKRHAPWHQRLIELRDEGRTHVECAKVLNQEGWTSTQGRELHVDSIRQYCWTHGLANQQPNRRNRKDGPISFCLYCGNRADKPGHGRCKVMLAKFRSDLSRANEGEKWRVFQAAENGAYSVEYNQLQSPKPRDGSNE